MKIYLNPIIILNVLNFLIPKKKNHVVFSGKPSFDDMLKGMVKHLAYADSVTILVDSESHIKPTWVPKHYKIKRKKSIIGIYSIIVSDRIYFTHGLFDGFKLLDKKRQYVINLWHGMPLKKIGRYLSKDEQCNFHVTLSTSTFFQKIMMNVFGVSEDKVLVSGLPRNDILLCDNKNVKILEKDYYNIVWLPTYQEKTNEETVFGFCSLDFSKINEILERKKIKLIIKPHPYENIKSDCFSDYRNIVFVNETVLNEFDCSLYEVLSSSDELWTDYSSVFVDYAYTGKEILFVRPNDIYYKSKRGLIEEVSSLDLPGFEINSESELIDYLCNKEPTKATISKPNMDKFITTSGFNCELIENYLWNR